MSLFFNNKAVVFVTSIVRPPVCAGQNAGEAAQPTGLPAFSFFHALTALLNSNAVSLLLSNFNYESAKSEPS
jgi:hypothetical protein